MSDAIETYQPTAKRGSPFGSGPAHPRWKGGKISSLGYRWVRQPGHPRAHANGYILEHVLVASRALGKPVPRGCPVHHVNGIGIDNTPSNLVVCQDQRYHRLLHIRARALKATGDPCQRRCGLCKTWDDPARMILIGRRSPDSWVHRACRNEKALTNWRQRNGR